MMSQNYVFINQWPIRFEPPVFVQWYCSQPKKINVWHQTLSQSLHRGCGLGTRPNCLDASHAKPHPMQVRKEGLVHTSCVNRICIYYRILNSVKIPGKLHMTYMTHMQGILQDPLPFPVAYGYTWLSSYIVAFWTDVKAKLFIASFSLTSDYSLHHFTSEVLVVFTKVSK